MFLILFFFLVDDEDVVRAAEVVELLLLLPSHLLLLPVDHLLDLLLKSHQLLPHVDERLSRVHAVVNHDRVVREARGSHVLQTRGAGCPGRGRAGASGEEPALGSAAVTPAAAESGAGGVLAACGRGKADPVAKNIHTHLIPSYL